MTLSARLQLHGLHSVGLEELVKLPLVTPAAFVVVELHFAAADVADHRIPPARQLHREAAGFTAEEPHRLWHRLRPRQPPTGRGDRHGVFHLCLDLHNVGHAILQVLVNLTRARANPGHVL